MSETQREVQKYTDGAILFYFPCSLVNDMLHLEY